MKFFFTISLHVLIFNSITIAQNLERFSHFSAFGFPGAVFGGVQKVDSFYIATGLAFDSINPSYDNVLWVKFNEKGEVVDAKTLPNTYGYQAWFRSFSDENNNLILHGWVFPQDNGDLFVIKVNSEGTALENNKYFSAYIYLDTSLLDGGITRCSAMYSTNDKGLVFVSSESLTSNEFTSFKLDSLGIRVWNKIYVGSQIEIPQCLIPDKFGGYLLGGRKSNPNNSYHRSHILKIDEQGEKIWEYTSPYNQGTVFSMLQNDEGELIVAAPEYDSTVSGLAIYPTFYPQIIKLDTARQVVWTTPLPQEWELNNHNFPSTLKMIDNGDGTYSGCGQSDGIIEGDTANFAHLFRITDDGELLWHRWYRYLQVMYWALHEFRDMQRTTDGGYVMVGWGGDFTVPPAFEGARQRAWIVKVDSFGCLVEDCQLVGTEEPTKEFHVPFVLYPNPASEVLYVQGSKYATMEGDYSLQLFNNQGVEVFSVKHIHPDITDVLPIHQLPTGVYHAQIYRQRQLVQSEKIIIQH